MEKPVPSLQIELRWPIALTILGLMAVLPNRIRSFPAWFAYVAAIAVNWQSEPDDQLTLPIGAGFGRVFNLGRQPVNMALSAYWNAVKPEGAADWTLRTQVTLLFP